MLDWLENHPDPLVRYKLRVTVQGQDPGYEEIRKLAEEARNSPRVQALLSDSDSSGQIPWHPYSKWQGAHWVLACLADAGYPPGDRRLLPLREQVCEWLFSADHVQGIERQTGKNRQVRLHASVEGNALFSMLALGLADERADRLVERLLWAQWDDGGWNCDRHANADTSSFHESIIPVRALAHYAQVKGDERARATAERAADIFLRRRMFRRMADGEVMRPEFLRLRWPAYWHYNFLFGLKVMAEAGLIGDPRCTEALDYLESKRLPDGGFPAEGKHYAVYKKPGERKHGGSRTDWGATASRQANEFVTLDALYVLKAAGR